MKEGQRLWTREELLLAINLYCKLPFGKLHRLNPEVVQLAKLLNRTPNSIAFKLVNFASLDPSLKARGIKGASNASKLDREVWSDFFSNWNELVFESESLKAKYEQTTIERLNDIDENELPKIGKTRATFIQSRVNQGFFRKTILAAYNNTCCITGLSETEFLIASHIRRWSEDEVNRLNPRNGLLLNALHDKAFECGYLTVTPDYKVKISSKLKDNSKKEWSDFFLKYDGKMIILPNRFLPDPEFLKYHYESRFIP